MIQHLQRVQRYRHMEDPLLVHHKQREDQDAGHGRYVKKAGFMHAEEKEFDQHHTGAQGFIERV